MSPTEKIMLDLANEIALDHQYENYDVKLKPISTDGANYTTVLFVATISAPGKENIEIFAKIANLGEEMRSQMPLGQVFKIERYFYTDLLKKYETLQEKNKIPHENRLRTAKYYTSSTELYKETLVLENLITKGYALFDRFKSVDWEYASKSIEELAKLHALSIAYSEENPEDYKKLVGEMKSVVYNENVNVFAQKMVETALNVVCESNRDRLNRFLKEELLPNMSKYYSPLRRPFLVHGDYRPSNLMYKLNNDGKRDFVLVDFQTIQAGCPLMDLLYFIFTSTDEKFRYDYFEKLVEHYYTQLCLALQRLRVDPNKVYPREDFKYELKEMLPFGLSVGALALQVVTVDSENAPQLDEMMLGTGTSLKTSELYSERLNGVVNDYIRWGII